MRDPDDDGPQGGGAGLAIIAAGLFFFLMVVMVEKAYGHSWYDPACCSVNDCAPIPTMAVTAGPDGWHVRLKPGEHPMVTRGPIEAVVPYDEALPSQDGGFHACVRDQSSPSSVMAEPIICLYVPDVGST
jgi:hypothetical protein